MPEPTTLLALLKSSPGASSPHVWLETTRAVEAAPRATTSRLVHAKAGRPVLRRSVQPSINERAVWGRPARGGGTRRGAKRLATAASLLKTEFRVAGNEKHRARN